MMMVSSKSVLFSLVAVYMIYQVSAVVTKSKTSFSSRNVTQDISHAITNLARDLSVQIANNRSKSDIISPISIGSSLLLLMRITRGDTRNELLKLLHLLQYQKNDKTIPLNFQQLITEFLELDQPNATLADSPTWRNGSKCISSEYDYDEEYDYDDPQTGEANIVRLANAVFVQKGMLNNAELVKRIKTLYRSTVEDVDFNGAPDRVTKHINKWVNENTNGRISQIVPDNLSRETTMIIANALYFKAFWEQVFIEGATKPKKFFPNGENEEPVEADIMANTGCFPYYFSKSLDAGIMGFPYTNRSTTMYVILPQNSNRNKLQQLMEKLDAQTLDLLISNMTMRSASILFPKMHITNSFDLKTLLQKMNVKAMFNPKRGSVDFTPMNNSSRISTSKLKVSGVMHKVDLEVNEAGTEGGAVTITLQDRIASSVNFRVLTPFLVAIRHDNTKLLLFYGPVYDPS
ncbi:serine protease inhibitor 28Dc-like isoform X2 [Wyeomyia smithii]|uniref:serine protease inhibitor 28Dc-like isoform X2 n=1 Tax=Wyeomyia smithii TaxID=174621 RepID=UPI002467FD6A|nr:serine protease inhibitor 28Dc-like isoform X2 [Wyeomyia smithii]